MLLCIMVEVLLKAFSTILLLFDANETYQVQNSGRFLLIKLMRLSTLYSYIYIVLLAGCLYPISAVGRRIAGQDRRADVFVAGKDVDEKGGGTWICHFNLALGQRVASLNDPNGTLL